LESNSHACGTIFNQDIRRTHSGPLPRGPSRLGKATHNTVCVT
jgi:hypothetical protein